jgi:hypothetical protein
MAESSREKKEKKEAIISLKNVVEIFLNFIAIMHPVKKEENIPSIDLDIRRAFNLHVKKIS